MKNTIENVKIVELYTSGNVVSANGDLVSSVIDISSSNLQGANIEILTSVPVYATGSLVFKQIEFSDDITFATDVTVQDVDYIEHFVASDSTSSDSAIAQTSLTARGISRIGVHPIVLKKYARVTLTAGDTADFTFGSFAIISGQKNRRVNQ